MLHSSLTVSADSEELVGLAAQERPEPNPPLLSPWLMRRMPGGGGRVNTSLSDAESAAVRLSSQRGTPSGNDD